MQEKNFLLIFIGLSLFLLPFAQCEEGVDEQEDIGMYERPPPSFFKEEFDNVKKLIAMPIYSVVSPPDEYGMKDRASQIVALQESLDAEARDVSVGNDAVEEEEDEENADNENSASSDTENNNAEENEEDLQEDTTPAAAEEEEQQEVATSPSDLLDLDVEELLNNNKEAVNDADLDETRSTLHGLRKKLQPLHRRICRKSFSACLARRRANVKILLNILRRKCHVGQKGCAAPRRRAPAHRRCIGHECLEDDQEHMYHINRVYRYLRRVYSRLYIRYAMTVARYYKKKFRVLTKVVVQNIKQLRWEAQQVNKENVVLRKRLAELQRSSANMRDRTAKEHAAQIKRMNDEAKQHADEKARVDRTHSDVRSELMREEGIRLRLQKELDGLNDQAAQEEAERKRNEQAAKEVAERAAALRDANRDLLDKIGSVTSRLDDAKARIQNLNELKDSLFDKKKNLQEILDRLKAQNEATQRAIDRIQASYNSLNNQLNALLASHKSADDKIQAQISDLKAQIAKAAARCVPDACGTCNGNEASCALTRSGRTCYSVGDPHLRTFDGMTYDYQHDGQFVYAWHGNPVNFEVQIMQRHAWPGSYPRYNKGVAVRGGRDIVIAYAAWYTVAVVFNGQRVNLPMQQWQRLSPGLAVYRQDGSTLQIRYTARDQTATVTLTSYGALYNFYVAVPWEWSSGRSLFGLCGDFDEWVGNDGIWISRNSGRLFTVTETARDMFKYPQRRTADIELNDHSPEEILLERRFDELNNVAHPEQLQKYEGTDLQEPSTDPKVPVPDVEVRKSNATVSSDGVDLSSLAKKKKGVIEKPSMAIATPAMQKEARQRCRGSHGQARKQCMEDILFGVAGKDARGIFRDANLLGKEKCLKRCMVLDKTHFAMFSPIRLPAAETAKEGVSVAFWWYTEQAPTSRCIMLERGRDFFVTQVGNDLSVGTGDLSCTVKDAFRVMTWAPVTIAIHHTRGLQVFVNDKPACAMSSNTTVLLPKDFRSDLIAGGADSKDTCVGRMAHLYYIPQTVTQKEVSEHGKISPLGCVRPSDDKTPKLF